MPYYRWGCFLYQSRVIVRAKEIVRVEKNVGVMEIVRAKVMVRVEVILYMLGLPTQSGCNAVF